MTTELKTFVVEKPSYFIQTYGCQMNVYDSSLVATILNREGISETRNPEEADIIIVNTCSVREHAEQRALGRICSLQRFRKERPNLKIGIIGCMAERLGDEIPGADFFIGPKSYRSLGEILRDVVIDTRPRGRIQKFTLPFPKPERSVNAFLPVMRGCNNFCSYCIVPYVRGDAVSRNPEEILSEVKFLKDRGIKEITLLGQSVNEYSFDDIDFARLLRMAAQKSAGLRIRFLTSHPGKMNHQLIDAIAECKPICENIHLPVQSGSNRILRNMERGYTVQEYKDWVHRLRERMPDIGITTDILVGFPGETEKDLEETIDMIRELRFDFAYMFMYSKREGTKAADLREEVPTNVKKERLGRIIQIQNRITREKNGELIGRDFEILIDGKSRRDDLPMGKTRNGREVILKRPKNKVGKLNIGDFVEAHIENLSGWTPVGRVL